MNDVLDLIDSPADLRRLDRTQLDRLAGQPVIVDLVTSNALSKPIAQTFNLKMQRPLLRMAYGPNTSPGQPSKILAICCPELG